MRSHGHVVDVVDLEDQFKSHYVVQQYTLVHARTRSYTSSSFIMLEIRTNSKHTDAHYFRVDAPHAANVGGGHDHYQAQEACGGFDRLWSERLI